LDPKGEITAEWTISCAQELYYSGGQIKDDEMDRTCNTHEGDKKFAENFSRRRRWEANIEKDLTEIAFKGVDLIHLAQDSVRCGRFL
jgi:hypothetical protein